MCIAKPQKPVPQASTLPTTQAADDLELANNDLNAGTPSGRLALSTRPRSAKGGTTSATAGSVLTAASAGVDPSGASAGTDTGASAGDVLTGRKPGSQQPFYTATP